MKLKLIAAVCVCNLNVHLNLGTQNLPQNNFKNYCTFQEVLTNSKRFGYIQKFVFN